MSKTEIKMPFTNESREDLEEVLMRIIHNPLCIEIFDAFLGNYEKSKDLKGSLYSALIEWDSI